jgi:hypothetical protein
MHGRLAHRSIWTGVIGFIATVAALGVSQRGGSRTPPTVAQVIPLRNLAAQQADWGSASTQLGERVFTNNPAALATIFHQDGGTVMCQGAAYYLHLLYLAAGFRSYLVGFGSDGFSHAMVLVEVVRPDGSRALIVEDPTFNITYSDNTGSPLSIQEIMTAVAQGELDAVRIDPGPRQQVDFLRDPADPDPLENNITYVSRDVPPTTTARGWLKYRANLDYETCAKLNAPLINRVCQERGLAPSLLPLIFDKPLYVYRRWPMSPEDLADANDMFAELTELSQRLRG